MALENGVVTPKNGVVTPFFPNISDTSSWSVYCWYLGGVSILVPGTELPERVRHLKESCLTPRTPANASWYYGSIHHERHHVPALRPEQRGGRGHTCDDCRSHLETFMI